MTKFTFATLNTHDGRFFESGMVEPLEDVDVAVFQELLHDPVPVDNQLRKVGMKLVAYSETMQLGIASKDEIETARTHEIPLQASGVIGHEVKKQWPESRASRWFKDRGVLIATASIAGYEIAFATTHVNVFARPLKRKGHLVQMPASLGFLASDNITTILGYDGNHRPGPKRRDIRMAEEAGFYRLDLNGQTTWVAEDAAPKYAAFKSVIRDAELDGILVRAGEAKIAERQPVEVVKVESDHLMPKAFLEIIEG